MGTSKKRIQYRYDAAVNRTLMIDPDGGRFTYAYDRMKRIKSVINPQGDRTTYSYNANGRRSLTQLANGTRASFTYDAASRLTRLANLKSDRTTISSFDYQYDKVGNRTSVLEADGSRVTYSYDPTYQLTGEHRTGTTPYRNTFAYDSTGNRTLKNEDGVRTTYAYDDANQLKYAETASGRTSYSFDADGNQELVVAPTGGRTTSTWDYENKTTLVQLPSGIRNTMAYEPDGLRMKLEDSGGTKKFVWDNQNYLAETDAANDTQVVYTNEPATYGNLISQHRLSGAVWTPSYYHFDALGSTRQLSDSGQAITDAYLYDAWGVPLTSSGLTVNPFRNVGRLGYYFDLDTGNIYIRARIYRPVIARWMSADPHRRSGQHTAYGYGSNAPTVLVDFTGRDAVVVFESADGAWGLMFEKPPSPLDDCTAGYKWKLLQTFTSQNTTPWGGRIPAQTWQINLRASLIITLENGMCINQSSKKPLKDINRFPTKGRYSTALDDALEFKAIVQKGLVCLATEKVNKLLGFQSPGKSLPLGNGKPVTDDELKVLQTMSGPYLAMVTTYVFVNACGKCKQCIPKEIYGEGNCKPSMQDVCYEAFGAQAARGTDRKTLQFKDVGYWENEQNCPC